MPMPSGTSNSRDFSSSSIVMCATDCWAIWWKMPNRLFKCYNQNKFDVKVEYIKESIKCALMNFLSKESIIHSGSKGYRKRTQKRGHKFNEFHSNLPSVRISSISSSTWLDALSLCMAAWRIQKENNFIKCTYVIHCKSISAKLPSLASSSRLAVMRR